MEISNAMAVCLGLGTVFAGLIGLILICYIMSSVVKLFAKSEKSAPQAAPQVAPQVAPVAANKGEFAAAVAAAIAEDLGTDVTGIRIKSIKRL